MPLFKQMGIDDHEQLLFFNHSPSGLRAVIAIHSTTLGPAAAGIRMWNYASENEAITDALRLSAAMTLRAAITRRDLGGGSCVVWGNPRTRKSEAALRALGRFINGLGGRLIVTSELGISYDDLTDIGRETPYAITRNDYDGETPPVHPTALGVFLGLQTCVQHVQGIDSLDDLTIAVQGVGQLGSSLVGLIREKHPQARILISDINYDKMKVLQDRYPELRIVPAQEIVEVPCDILVPCALGGIIDARAADQLKCRIIAGGASNVLVSEDLVDRLHGSGILFAPDFIINAGDMLRMVGEMSGQGWNQIRRSIERIPNILDQVFTRAAESKLPPYRVARAMAEERLAAVAATRRIMS